MVTYICATLSSESFTLIFMQLDSDTYKRYIHFIYEIGNVHRCVSKCLQNTSLSHKIVRRIINRVSNLWCEKLCFLYYNYYVVLNGCVREINCRRLQFCNYYNKESFYQFNLKPCLVLSEDFQIQPTFQVGNFLNNIRYDNEEI